MANKKVQFTQGILLVVEKAVQLLAVTREEYEALQRTREALRSSGDLARADFAVLREMSKRYDALHRPLKEMPEMEECINHALAVGGRDEQ